MYCIVLRMPVRDAPPAGSDVDAALAAFLSATVIGDAQAVSSNAKAAAESALAAEAKEREKKRKRRRYL